MKQIEKSFPITNEEYWILDEKYGQLAEYQSWQLLKKNSRNNHTHEQEDISQEIRMALMRSASYYKRQCYIEECLELATKHVKDKFIKAIVEQLTYLWKNKTRHGASKQKFGPHQEAVLDRIVRHIVPPSERPNRRAPLKMDSKYSTYCKAITWNTLKAMGKKITREKSIRSGMVSISEYDYLVSG
jgi:hypothetical protein